MVYIFELLFADCPQCYKKVMGNFMKYHSTQQMKQTTQKLSERKNKERV